MKFRLKKKRTGKQIHYEREAHPTTEDPKFFQKKEKRISKDIDKDISRLDTKRFSSRIQK